MIIFNLLETSVNHLERPSNPRTVGNPGQRIKPRCGQISKILFEKSESAVLRRREGNFSIIRLPLPLLNQIYISGGKSELKGFIFVEVRDGCRLYVDRERSLLFTQELCAVSEKVKLCKLLFLAWASAHVPCGFAARSSRALAPVARSRSIVTQKKIKRLLAV